MSAGALRKRQHGTRHYLSISLEFVALCLLLSSCMPTAQGSESLGSAVGHLPINQPDNLQYHFVERLPMRGDPSFDVASLAPEVQLWHERLTTAMRHEDQILDSTRLAQSDDAYEYGRGLYTYNHSLLLGLRVTGDLRFLDEVERVTQIMREKLDDSWCGGVEDEVYVGSYGTVEGRDGYLNFRRRYEEGETYCRDSNDLEEAMVHGHLAMVMHAFHLNRDLESPAGVDYGERADFWYDYLRNHFEAKWRERSDTRFPRMDFIDLKFCHTFNTFNLYYYYMGKALEDRDDRAAGQYLEYARHLTDLQFETAYLPGRRSGGFIRTETPIGDAVVYSFRSPGWRLDRGETGLEACPTTYARYMAAAIVQMRLEGFYRWDDRALSLIANGLAHFVFDTEEVSANSAPLAAGVTGSDSVEGIPETEYRDRLPVHQYAVSTLANLMPWDASGDIESVSRQIYRLMEENLDAPRRLQLPASFLLDAALGELPE